MNSTPPPFRTPLPARPVVFDLDNTLVDTLGVIVDAFNAVMIPEVGRPLDAAEVVSHFGPTEENCIRRAIRTTPPDVAIERFRTRYIQGMRDVSVYPGIRPVLERLRRAGRPLALSTGKGRWTTDATLDALGLGHLFAMIVTGDDVENNKPHPEPLLRIAEANGCPPEELIMVGDALADIASARAVGATGLLVLWGDPDTRRPEHHRQATRDASAVFRTVEELDRWFEEHGVYAPATGLSRE